MAQELMDNLKNQINFLLRSSKAYDNGYTDEAIRLAGVLRVLLHDTRRSTSLLKLLNKKQILFYDTSEEYSPNYLFSNFSGLTEIELGQTPKYVPPLDAPHRYQKGKIPFKDWWTKVVLCDNKTGKKVTRKDLVLNVCNKKGGAHVDPNLDLVYENIVKQGGGWKTGTGEYLADPY